MTFDNLRKRFIIFTNKNFEPLEEIFQMENNWMSEEDKNFWKRQQGGEENGYLSWQKASHIALGIPVRSV
jgi:hypothetical protein